MGRAERARLLRRCAQRVRAEPGDAGWAGGGEVFVMDALADLLDLGAVQVADSRNRHRSHNELLSAFGRTDLRLSHHATCPAGSAWRRRRRGR